MIKIKMSQNFVKLKWKLNKLQLCVLLLLLLLFKDVGEAGPGESY